MPKQKRHQGVHTSAWILAMKHRPNHMNIFRIHLNIIQTRFEYSEKPHSFITAYYAHIVEYRSILFIHRLLCIPQQVKHHIWYTNYSLNNGLTNSCVFAPSEAMHICIPPIIPLQVAQSPTGSMEFLLYAYDVGWLFASPPKPHPFCFTQMPPETSS